MNIFLLLCLSLLIPCQKSLASSFHKNKWLDNRLFYNFVSPDFVPLNRVKRGADSDNGDDADESFQIPNDIEIQKDDIDHKYYLLKTSTNQSDMVKDYYFDVEEMLKKPGTVGNISHPLLSNSYRKAVAAKIQFEFPFYGFRLKNLTITTGGFFYVGDQSHSWLALTQFIAPLMANFDTQSENSTIMYADDGEKFVTEWRGLQLQTQKEDGYFTFQVSLHKNGDIWFVYKNIPIPVRNINDSHHPVKVGVSDAYLFNYRIRPTDDKPPVIKRVIYQYHRIDIDPASITSNTVIRLIALPTCIHFRTCEECSNASLVHFNCSWCHSKPAHGGPFCSDTAGLHRRRQHWLDANCQSASKVTYCKAEDDFKEVEDVAVTNILTASALTSKPIFGGSSVAPLQTNDKEKYKTDRHALITSSSTPYSWLVFLLVLIVLIVCWFGYAYFNPHTTSGQFLIKYRPSQWRMPSSHVRYSASVHM